MAHMLLVHISNEEPFLAEVRELPQPGDQVLICNSPRRRDGKDVHMFLPEVVTVIFPWTRVNFVEVMPSETAEDIISFVRE